MSLKQLKQWLYILISYVKNKQQSTVHIKVNFARISCVIIVEELRALEALGFGTFKERNVRGGVKKDMFLKPHPSQLSDNCEVLKQAEVDMASYVQSFDNVSTLGQAEVDFLEKHHPAFRLFRHLFDYTYVDAESDDNLSQATVQAKEVTVAPPLREEDLAAVHNADSNEEQPKEAHVEVAGERLSLSDLVTAGPTEVVSVRVRQTGEGKGVAWSTLWIAELTMINNMNADNKNLFYRL